MTAQAVDEFRNVLLRVAQGFCANSLKCSVAPLKVRNRSFSRSKCKSCHDIDPYKDSRTSKYCDRYNSATCSYHAKILYRNCIGETQALFRDFVKFSNIQKLFRSSCKE